MSSLSAYTSARSLLNEVPEADKGYNWEQGFERSWEKIAEDENGLLQAESIGEEQRQRKRRFTVSRTVQKGMIRYMYLIIDLSRSMADMDIKPNRLTVIKKLVEDFILNYFDQNPLSNIGLIVTRSGKAEKVTDLSGNPKRQIEALKSSLTTSGEPSLQNSLELARSSLQIIPAYGNCEVVIIYGSLSTADPGDIHTSIKAMAQEKIRCSVVGLGAEVFILRKLANETGGTYVVAQDKEHLSELMSHFLVPPPKVATSAANFASLVQMGFPQRKQEKIVSLCICHQEFKLGGYFCPRCKAKVCELPTTCGVCSLPLVSSPHLARSYHHLFPVEPFVELLGESRAKDVFCHGCITPLLEDYIQMQCTLCKKLFCVDCDIYIHESLHNCPGCA